jgi:hypothetical protein
MMAMEKKPSPATPTERRKSQRYAARGPVRIKTSNATQAKQGECRDLSRNGLFFFLGEPMTTGTDIELVMMLPDEITAAGQQWVCCRGRVVRVEEPAAPGKFGIAATFDRYTIVPEAVAAPAP